MRKNVQNGAIMFTLALVFALVMGGAASAAPSSDLAQHIWSKTRNGFDGFEWNSWTHGLLATSAGTQVHRFPRWQFPKTSQIIGGTTHVTCLERNSCGCNNFIR